MYIIPLLYRPGHTLYETVDKPKSFTHSPPEYESLEAVTAGQDTQMQDNPSYNVINHDGLQM